MSQSAKTETDYSLPAINDEQLALDYIREMAESDERFRGISEEYALDFLKRSGAFREVVHYMILREVAMSDSALANKAFH